MQRIDFVLLSPDERLPDPLKGISLALEIDAEQPASAGGLGFRLRVDNASDASVAIKNPYDLLTYSLANADGWPIGQKAPPSRIKSHGRGIDQRPKYLALIAVSSGGSALDVAAEIARNVVEVPARSAYAYDLRIESIVGPQGAAGPVTIVPGAYALKCVLSLISELPAQPTGAVMQTESVTVQVK